MVSRQVNQNKKKGNSYKKFCEINKFELLYYQPTGFI